MFGIINLNTRKLVTDSGSEITEEQKPMFCIFEHEEHALEYHKFKLLSLSDYKVVPITSITWE